MIASKLSGPRISVPPGSLFAESALAFSELLGSLAVVAPAALSGSSQPPFNDFAAAPCPACPPAIPENPDRPSRRLCCC